MIPATDASTLLVPARTDTDERTTITMPMPITKFQINQNIYIICI